MSANIDTSNGRQNIAYLGSRKDVWHHLGNEMKPGMSVADWRVQSGLGWEAVMLPAYTEIPGKGMIKVEDQYHIARGDTWHILSPRTASGVYKPHQPEELFSFAEQYISVDPRFELDTAMSLRQGEIIAISAKFNGGMVVAGDNHVARLLMTTTFDFSGATICKAHVERVVCNNTLNIALGQDRSAGIKTRHNTRFDKSKIGRELAQIVKGFAAYKTMGDAMATKHLADAEISKLFKSVLDIPFEAKAEDVSTRKMNQLSDLSRCYSQTVRENDAHKGTAWAALNAVTRYVDHDRSTRGGDAGEARFVSAQFGTGAALKEKAVMVLNEMCDGDLLRAVSAKTSDAADVSAILKQAFRPTLVG